MTADAGIRNDFTVCQRPRSPSSVIRLAGDRRMPPSPAGGRKGERADSRCRERGPACGRFRSSTEDKPPRSANSKHFFVGRAGVGAPYRVNADSPDGLLWLCAAARNAGDGVPYRACADSPKVEASRTRVLRARPRAGRRPRSGSVPSAALRHDASRPALDLVIDPGDVEPDHPQGQHDQPGGD